MSNHLAIATVTGTLQRVLTKAVTTIVDNTEVKMTRPDGTVAAPGAGIYIFLYQVTPNAAYRNTDLPTRRSNGDVVQRPQAALVLHYLLSFTGDEALLQPQCLLGAVVRHLHAHPLLAHNDITDTMQSDALKNVLGKSTLAEQVETVRFTPLNLSLEELSKVWSVFFQTPYLLSVAYQASAVLLETDDVPPAAPPVKSRNVYVVPFRPPLIERIVSAAGDEEPIIVSSALRIAGARFRADATFVLLDGVERVPDDVRDDEVRLQIPAGVAIGVHAVQIVQKQLIGADPGTLHRGFESNVATFVLRPHVVISKVVQDGVAALNLKFDPAVGKKQRVLLMLNSATAAPPKAFSFVDPARDADATAIVFKIAAVPGGTYFVTVQVDGAANSFGTVTLP